MINLIKAKILSNIKLRNYHTIKHTNIPNITNKSFLTLRKLNIDNKKFTLQNQKPKFCNKIKVCFFSQTKDTDNSSNSQNSNASDKLSSSDIDTIKYILNSITTEEGKSLIDLKLLYDIRWDQTTQKIKILLNLHKDFRKIKSMIENKLSVSSELKDKLFEILIAPQEAKSESKKKVGLSKVKNIIAVSSCKGGVGKSTVSVNLAFALMQHKQKVGIFDADIYGPSLPTMISPKDATLRYYDDSPDLIIPIEFSGIKAMSFGFAAPGRRAVMRGPIVSNLVTQLVCNTDWGELDYLIVDMPPGTGDIQISLCQELNFSGGVVVTTPQKLSFIDVVKGIEMFDELKIPILSVVENMSYFTCENCDTQHHIFGRGYVSMLKKQFGIEDSFSLPIDPMISRVSDLGSPYVLVAPETNAAQQTFKNISSALITRVNFMQASLKHKPSIEYDPKDEMIYLKLEGGQVKKISPLHLRKKCICAACIDEFTGEKLLKEKQIPNDVYPKKMEDKGNYAVAVVWSDGHRSSIYPYKRLMSDEIESAQ